MKLSSAFREVWEVLNEKYFTFGKNQSFERLERVKVRTAISNLCEQHLTTPGDVFTFEIMPQFLGAAVSVMGDELLTSRYIITQVSESLFEVRLVVLEGMF